MDAKKNPYPFEATFKQIQADTDTYVAAVFESLQSEFLNLPRGRGSSTTLHLSVVTRR